MNDDALNRETRPNRKAKRRKTRKPAPLEYVGDVRETPQPARPVNVTPREQVPRAKLGTIPKPFTVGDVLGLIAIIGLPAWKRMGVHKRQAALEDHNG